MWLRKYCETSSYLYDGDIYNGWHIKEFCQKIGFLLSFIWTQNLKLRDRLLSFILGYVSFSRNGNYMSKARQLSVLKQNANIVQITYEDLQKEPTSNYGPI